MSETKSNRCANYLLRKSHKWKQGGTKEDPQYFLTSCSPKCQRCTPEGLDDDCVRESYKQAFPNTPYDASKIYVNLKRKAEEAQEIAQNAEAKTEEVKQETQALAPQ